MRKETINIYRFSELSEEAKEKAIQNMYDINISFDWWDYIYEEAESLGFKIEGFNLGRGAYISISPVLHIYDIAKNVLNICDEDCEFHNVTKKFLAKYEKAEKDFNDNYVEALESKYLSIIQNEYDYLTSKEAIIESIEANNYEFLENGDIY